jgi:ssDNA-binding Zn-finger/Zn-ribbon topoisomerase 1
MKSGIVSGMTEWYLTEPCPVCGQRMTEWYPTEPCPVCGQPLVMFRNGGHGVRTIGVAHLETQSTVCVLPDATTGGNLIRTDE